MKLPRALLPLARAAAALVAAALAAAGPAGAQNFEPTPDLPRDRAFLSPPTIVEPLYACADSVAVEGFIPGAEIELFRNGLSVAREPSAPLASVHAFIVTPPLAPNDVLTATQTWNEPNGPVTSNPSPEARVRDHTVDYPTLGPPRFSEYALPFSHCGRAVAATDFVPGAAVEVVAEDPLPGGGFGPEHSVARWPHTNSRSQNVSATWQGSPPLAEDQRLTARFSICGDPSPPSAPEFVGPEPTQLPQPVVTVTDNRYGSGTGELAVGVTELIPGATVDIFIDGSRVFDVTAVGRGVGFSLPSTVQPQQEVTAQQRFCGAPSLESEPAEVPPATACRDLPPAAIAPPRGGDDTVTVIQRVPGSRILIFADDGEIGDGGGEVIRLRRRVLAGEELIVLQVLGSCESRQVQRSGSGCGERPSVHLPPGDFGLGYLDFTYPQAVEIGGKKISIAGTVHYPAPPQVVGYGADLSPEGGPFPLVVLAHGRRGPWRGPDGDTCIEDPSSPVVESFRGFGYLLDQLARNGYVAVSLDFNGLACTEPKGAPNVEERALLLEEALGYLAASADRRINPGIDDAFDGKFFRRINLTRIGLLGHSRGAEAVVRAAQDCRAGCGGLPAGSVIGGVVSLAPTDGLDVALEGVPLLVILPAADGDLQDSPGAVIYDRAREAGIKEWFKSQFYVWGAGHNLFNSQWLDDEWGSSGNPISLSRAEHEEALRAWAHAFFELTIKGDDAYLPPFRGDAVFGDVSIQDRVYPSYHAAGALLLDDFEGLNGVTPNSRNGRVTDTGFRHVEDRALVKNVNQPFCNPGNMQHCGFDTFYHQTDGMLARWEQAASFTTEFQAAPGEDFGAFAVLSFRVAQAHDTLLNRPRDPLRVRVAIGDSAGNWATALSTAGGEIPRTFPHPNEPKSMLRTIRIPLACFAPRERPVNLRDATTLQFEFGDVPASGAAGIDDIAFSN